MPSPELVEGLGQISANPMNYTDFLTQHRETRAPKGLLLDSNPDAGSTGNLPAGPRVVLPNTLNLVGSTYPQA